MSKRSVLLGLFCVVCFTVPAGASPLGLTVPSDPLVVTDAVLVEYTLTGTNTGHLSASGNLSTYNDGPESTVTLNGQYGLFQLEVDLYRDGGFVGGSVELRGAVDANPQPPVLFYSDNLTDFGFGIDDTLEFLFTQTGAGVPPVNAPFGVILLWSGFSGDPVEGFSQPFNSFYGSQADTFYVPEPLHFVCCQPEWLGFCVGGDNKPSAIGFGRRQIFEHVSEDGVVTVHVFFN